jgi:hypothetical protein
MFQRRHSAGQKIAAHLEALQADIRTLRDDSKGLARSVGDAADAAALRARDTCEDAEKWTVEKIRPLHRAIGRQPLAACLVSIGIGALVGALFLRR